MHKYEALFYFVHAFLSMYFRANQELIGVDQGQFDSRKARAVSSWGHCVRLDKVDNKNGGHKTLEDS